MFYHSSGDSGRVKFLHQEWQQDRIYEITVHVQSHVTVCSDLEQGQVYFLLICLNSRLSESLLEALGYYLAIFLFLHLDMN